MKRRGLSETRFPKVWCRSELCSRGERPFEVSKIFCPGTKPGRYETRPVRYLNPAGQSTGLTSPPYPPPTPQVGHLTFENKNSVSFCVNF